jgi:hypothetical protein
MPKDFKKQEILGKVDSNTKTENIEQTTETKPVAKTKEVKPVTKVRKQVTRDIEVAIMNNTHGGFIYIDPKTFSRHEMTGYGDIDYITVGELLNMKNSQRAIIDNFWIVIVEVLSDDVELEDVIRYLSLEDLYKNALNKDEMDKLITKSTPVNFKKAFDTIHKGMADRIVERALELFKAGKFNDWSKFDVIKIYTQNDMIFDLSTSEN